MLHTHERSPVITPGNRELKPAFLLNTEGVFSTLISISRLCGTLKSWKSQKVELLSKGVANSWIISGFAELILLTQLLQNRRYLTKMGETTTVLLTGEWYHESGSVCSNGRGETPNARLKSTMIWVTGSATSAIESLFAPERSLAPFSSNPSIRGSFPRGALGPAPASVPLSAVSAYAGTTERLCVIDQSPFNHR